VIRRVDGHLEVFGIKGTQPINIFCPAGDVVNAHLSTFLKKKQVL